MLAWGNIMLALTCFWSYRHQTHISDMVLCEPLHQLFQIQRFGFFFVFYASFVYFQSYSYNYPLYFAPC